MKRTILTALVLALTLGTLACILGFQQQIRVGGTLAPGAPRAVVPEPAAATAAPATPSPSYAPAATPVAEDPAQLAQMAWEALFVYPSHEAPIRVLALLNGAGGPGDILYQQMLEEGKLMPKGAYYADAGDDPAAWVTKALKATPVGLLDSIYAETPALALAAYNALREAGRNDSVEVISAGITEEIIAALQEDRFSMGAAAGAYENELRVVYAEEFTGK